MTWWMWILFWIVFWAGAAAYLIWRTWRLWPHVREFGSTVQTAWSRTEAARQAASDATSVPERKPGREVTTVPDVDSLAWNRTAASWRAEWRSARKRRRALRLDEHAETWASWRRRVD